MLPWCAAQQLLVRGLFASLYKAAEFGFLDRVILPGTSSLDRLAALRAGPEIAATSNYLVGNTVHSPAMSGATSAKVTDVVFLATAWGTRHGGENTFNLDLCIALARLVRAEPQSSLRVVCVVPSSQVATDIVDGVEVIELGAAPEYQDLPPHCASKIVEQLERHKLAGSVIVGHDLHTGPTALAVCDILRGHSASRAAIVLHTDPPAYKAFEGDPDEETEAKVRRQTAMLHRADVVFAVGPRLAIAAADKLRGQGIQPVQLIPGLAPITTITEPSRRFEAITFGRFASKTDRNKQSRLAVVSFADVLGNLGHDPILRLVGIDQKDDVQAIKDFAETRAQRRLPILALPFNEDRKTLWDTLAQQSASLMLSLHEGFGLTGWESIAAGVPLVISTSTGLFDHLRHALGPQATGCVHAITLKGPFGTDEFNPADIQVIGEALTKVAGDPIQAKRGALQLREMCSRFTWESTAREFAAACGVEFTRPGVAGRYRSKNPPEFPSAPDKPDLAGQNNVISSTRADDDRPQVLMLYSATSAASSSFAKELQPYITTAGAFRIVDSEQLDRENLNVSACIGIVDIEYFQDTSVVVDRFPSLLQRDIAGELCLLFVHAKDASLNIETFGFAVDGGTHFLQNKKWCPTRPVTRDSDFGYKAATLIEIPLGVRARYYNNVATEIQDWFRPRTYSTSSATPPESPVQPPWLIKQLFAVASRHLAKWPKTILQSWIERPEYATTVGLLASKKRSATIILGPPGSGKSALLSKIISETTLVQGWTILAVKADEIPGDISSIPEFAAYIGLDGDLFESLRVASAQEQPLLLVVDQLDTLSSIGATNLAAFEIIIDIMNFVGELDNAHVLGSCRTSDFKYDLRYRRLNAQALTLAPIEREYVRNLFSENGLAPPPDVVMGLLGHPIHLRLMIEQWFKLGNVVAEMSAGGHIWQVIIPALISKDAIDYATTIAQWMGASGRLTCTDTAMIAHPLKTELHAAGLTTDHVDGLIFVHQTIFEWFWARSFLTPSLAQRVLEGDKTVSGRTGIRNAMRHLKLTSNGEFYKQLKILWPHIPRHLHLVAHQVVAESLLPVEEDAAWIRGLALSADASRHYLLRRLRGEPWFDFLKDDIGALMKHADSDGAAVGPLLISVSETRTQQVIDLIREHWLKEPSLRSALWIAESLPWSARSVRDFWHDLSLHPECDALVLCHYLENRKNHQRSAARCLASYLVSSIRRISEGSGEEDRKVIRSRLENFLTHLWSIDKIVNMAPAEFIYAIWTPFTTSIWEVSEGEDFLTGYRNTSGFFQGGRRTASTLIAPIKRTLRLLADEDARQFIEKLAATGGSSLDIQRMLVECGMIRIAERDPRSCIEWVLEDPRRLLISSRLDSEPWVSRKLLQAICSSELDSPATEMLRLLEVHILQLGPYREWQRKKGISELPDPAFVDEQDVLLRLGLLSALGDRLSLHAKDWFMRQESKFERGRLWYNGRPTSEADFAPRWLESPVMATEILDKDDSTLLKLLDSMGDDAAMGFDPVRGLFVGEFAKAMGANPERADTLFANFAGGKHSNAVAEIISEWARSGHVDIVCSWVVWADSNGFDSQAFRVSAALALSRVSSEGLPSECIDMLERWLSCWPRNEPQPAAEDSSYEIADSLTLDNARHNVGREGGVSHVFEAFFRGISYAPKPDLMRLGHAFATWPFAFQRAEDLKAVLAATPAAFGWDEYSIVAYGVIDVLLAKPLLATTQAGAGLLAKLIKHLPKHLEQTKFADLIYVVEESQWAGSLQLATEVAVIARLRYGHDWAIPLVERALAEGADERRVSGLIHIAAHWTEHAGIDSTEFDVALKWMIWALFQMPPSLNATWVRPLLAQARAKVPRTEALIPLVIEIIAKPQLLEGVHGGVLDVANQLAISYPSLAFGLALAYIKMETRPGGRSFILARGPSGLKDLIKTLQNARGHRYNALVLLETLLERNAWGIEGFLEELDEPTQIH